MFWDSHAHSSPHRRATPSPLRLWLFGDPSSLKQRLERGVQTAVLFSLVTLATLAVLHGESIAGLVAVAGLLAFAMLAAASNQESGPVAARRRERSLRDGALRIKHGRIVRARPFGRHD